MPSVHGALEIAAAVGMFISLSAILLCMSVTNPSNVWISGARIGNASSATVAKPCSATTNTPPIFFSTLIKDMGLQEPHFESPALTGGHLMRVPLMADIPGESTTLVSLSGHTLIAR